jgi:RNA polymerase sigma factor (sigma-70 family)
MADAHLGTVLRHLRSLAAGRPRNDPPDPELLRDFATRNDQGAFTALVQRHGPLVLAVCRRLLRHEQDAEDAFQATFLVLARKAASIRKGEALASWLYGVAHRMALNARRAARRRLCHEDWAAPATPAAPESALAWREVQGVLDQEIQRLPERYRVPFLLYYLENKRHAAVARELGVKEGTVWSRLGRARRLLQQRLTRRGVSLPAALAVLTVGAEGARAALSRALLASTARAATLCAAGQEWAGVAAPGARALVRGAKVAASAKLAVTTALLLTAAALGLGLYAVARRPTGRPSPPAGQTDAPRPHPAGRKGGLQAAGPKRPDPGRRQGRVDAYGDPLPAGARARLGTLRLRDGGPLRSMSLSADGKTLAARGWWNAVRLWRLPGGKEVRSLYLGQISQGPLALAPDARTLAAGDGTAISLRAVATGKEIRRLKWETNAVCDALAFAPGGKILASAHQDNRIRLWDVTGGKPLRQLRGHASLWALGFSADGRRLVSGGGQTARLWDVRTGKELVCFKGHDSLVYAVALSSDGKRVATAGLEDKTARLWDTATGRELRRVRMRGAVVSAALSPDGKLLAALDAGGTVGLWDAATGQGRWKFAGHHQRGLGVVLFPADGKSLLSAGADGAIRVWNPARGQEVGAFGGHGGTVASVAFSPDATTLATGGEDKTARLWDTTTYQETRRLELPAPVSALAFSPDGETVATAAGPAVQLWDAATGKRVRRLKGHRHAVTSLAFTGDGRTLASGSAEDAIIRLWDLPAGTARATLKGAGDKEVHDVRQALSLAFSPDGKVLASGRGLSLAGQARGSLRLWDVAGGKELRRGHFRGRGAFVASLAFSPDGRVLAAAMEGTWIRLWEVATGRVVREWQAERWGASDFPFFFAVAFSPDGKALASGAPADRPVPGDFARVVRVWEVATGKERLAFSGHRGPTASLAFAPDGRSLASGSTDTSVLIWDLTSPGSKGRGRGALSEQELAGLWADLSAHDAAKAYQAMCVLSLFPRQSVSFLKGRLAPVQEADAQRTARLVADLDSERFAVRAKAAKGLRALGEAAEPALRRALAGNPSLELRTRLGQLLKRLERSPGRLCPLRAVEVLERMGTPEARKLLQTLAEGAPGAWLSQEAHAALARLAKRSSAVP